MGTSFSAQPGLARTVYTRLLLGVPALWAILFIPAGTLAYWEAWLYLAILLIPMFFVFRYLLKNDPQLLERRMQMREREVAQRRIISLSYLYFLVAFTLPGFDQRWGWSDVPPLVVIAADLVVMLGYGIFFLVLRENQYAARTIQVEQGQRVISSGPYALVRHPMYLGVTLMYLASPLALGSYWALLPALLIVPILVARIINEEQVLERDLAGYREYKQLTRYRLLPGVW
ncbi:MAG: isoprenylcysteine carboxylmethyltransferase family protein [Anaerolineae bacterium]|jgi:protein-S-isoprenylcysteine O-methyltransferase Ste14|nr:isoprenylcysteine carboxylmethyltransferase family protein [Anaerolineae bacterium]